MGVGISHAAAPRPTDHRADLRRIRAAAFVGPRGPSLPQLAAATRYTSRRMVKDIAFEMAVSSVRFGVGVTREVGMDLKELGARLVMVVTDPVVARLPPMRTVVDSLDQHHINYAIYDRVRVEPSDQSFLDAIAFGNA